MDPLQIPRAQYNTITIQQYCSESCFVFDKIGSGSLALKCYYIFLYSRAYLTN